MTAETLTITKQVRLKAKFIGFTYFEQIFKAGSTRRYTLRCWLVMRSHEQSSMHAERSRLLCACQPSLTLTYLGPWTHALGF